MADTLPQNMSELLSGIEHEWKELWRAVARLTPEQMVTPDAGAWSPRDNLAHLDEWLHFMQEAYLGKTPAPEAMQIESAVYSSLDEDGINAVLFERNRDRPVSDVIDRLKRRYAAAMETIRATPFADLLRPMTADDPEKRPVMLWVLGNTSEHFREHRAVIERNL